MIRADQSTDVPADPRAMLASLSARLFENESWLQDCEPVEARDIPPAARSLLVHNRHMTATLRAHYDQPLALRVLRHVETEEDYRRMIVLTVDDGIRVVEFGLVRMNLNVLPPAARKEVVARKLPLGEIFSQHDVLTRVEPRWYLRFAAKSPVVQYFAPGTPPEAFGRLGVIHCNGHAAVELLEVVPG